MKKKTERTLAIGVSLLVGSAAWPIACVGGAPQFTPVDDAAGGGDAGGQVVPDARASGDGASAPRCDPSQPFDTRSVIKIVDLPGINRNPFVSADELTVYFDTNAVPDDSGSGDFDLVMGTRNDLHASFDHLTAIKGVNSAYDDNHPWVSANKRMLLFASKRDGGSNSSLFSATLNASANAYDTVQPLGVNDPAASEGDPFLQVGVALWFSSTLNDSKATVRRAPVTVTGFGAAIPVAGLSQPDDMTNTPFVTADGLALYYTLWPHGTVPYQVWRATWDDTNKVFSNPRAVSELNADGGFDNAVGSLSPDGCRVYFSSGREGGGKYNIFMAERTPH